MDLSTHKRDNRRFWLMWVVVTSVAGSLALLLAALLVYLLIILPHILYFGESEMRGDSLVPHLIVYGFGLVLFTGGLISVGQSLLLRRFAGYHNWLSWVLTTSLGVDIACIILVFTERIFPALSANLSGTILGLAQSFVLPRIAGKPGRRYIWIVISGIAAPFALLTGQQVVSLIGLDKHVGFPPFYPWDSALYYSLTWLIILALYAAITGAGLIWLLGPGPRTVREEAYAPVSQG